MKTITLRQIVVAAVIVGISCGFARADRQEILSLLDEDLQLELTEVTIAEALQQIGNAADVNIVLSDEAIWKLPNGEVTELSVTLDGPLSDCLAEMLNAFFMRYAVGNEQIVIYPREELQHIIGRPSTQQLELLQKIYTIQIPVAEDIEVNELNYEIEEKFGSISFSPYDTTTVMAEIIDRTGKETGLSLAVLLDQYGEARKSTFWYISKMDFPDRTPVINIVGEDEFREVRLNQIIDISLKDERVADILQTLANMADFKLVVVNDSGFSAWQDEIISFEMLNTRLVQAVQSIVSSLDGEVGIYPDEIGIRGPSEPESKVVVRTVRSRPPVNTGSTTNEDSFNAETFGEGYVGKISIPMDGGSYFIEFMLRESDLTEQLRKLREEKMQEILETLGTPETTD